MDSNEARRLEAELTERELCRRRFEPFIARMTDDFLPGWHIGKIASIAEKAEYAVNHPRDLSVPRRFVITMPPRHAKSRCIAQGLPLWALARNPKLEVIVATYGDDLSKEHGDWCKGQVDNPAFKAVFPDFNIRRDSKSKNRLITKEGGGARFVGAGAGITGRGAHILLIDDPIKNKEEADSVLEQEKLWGWFWTVAMTRLAPGGVVVIMHTRWSVNDLIGRVLKQDAEQNVTKSTWNVTNFPAIAEEDEEFRRKGEALHPARFDTAYLEELKANMPPRDWLALYQQRPVAEEGNFFKRQYIQTYNPTTLPKNAYFYITTDFAVSTKEDADHTCLWPYCVDHLGNMFFLPDFFYDRVDSGASVRALMDMAERYNPLNIQIEAGVIRQAIGPLLEFEMQRRKRWFTIVSPPVTKDKRTRAVAAQGMMEMSKIFFPATSRFEFTVVPQLLSFSGRDGEEDDLIDGISMACRTLKDQISPGPVLEGDPDNYELEDPDDDDEAPSLAAPLERALGLRARQAKRPLPKSGRPRSRSLFDPDSWI